LHQQPSQGLPQDETDQRQYCGFGLPSWPGEVTYFCSELPGFGYRIRASGVRRWVVQYEMHGRTRRVTIGDPRVLSAEQARHTARQHLAKKALGIDVAAEKAEARIAAKLTLGSVTGEFLADRASKLRPSSMAVLERDLLRWWKPLHGLPLHNVTRKDVAAYLSGPPVAAARARASLMQLYAWAIKQGLAEANPVINTPIPDEHVRPRERVLSMDEIAAIWKACDRLSAYDTIVRLLIVTACRRQEIGSLRRSELDRKNGLLIIPAERAKSHRDFQLPIPPLAWKLIDDWCERSAFPDHLFSGKGFRAWAINKRALDARCGVTGWTLHDIRRSVATHLGDMGVVPTAIEAILGHVLGSRVARTYNRSAYVNEIRVTLATWADRLTALIEGVEKKIVPLHPRS
jgi:integrase